jgi:hypothetical protein
LEGKEIELRGITGKPGKVISSNGMTKLLKKGHQGVIAQLCSLDVQTSKEVQTITSTSRNLQRICRMNLKCHYLENYPSYWVFKYVKETKEVEYLSHIVSHEGVKVDPNKIKAMMD